MKTVAFTLYRTEQAGVRTPEYTLTASHQDVTMRKRWWNTLYTQKRYSTFLGQCQPCPAMTEIMQCLALYLGVPSSRRDVDVEAFSLSRAMRCLILNYNTPGKDTDFLIFYDEDLR